MNIANLRVNNEIICVVCQLIMFIIFSALLFCAGLFFNTLHLKVFIFLQNIEEMMRIIRKFSCVLSNFTTSLNNCLYIHVVILKTLMLNIPFVKSRIEYIPDVTTDYVNH